MGSGIAEFDATVSEIKSLGTLRSASVNSQDVTEEYVDLQAQKAALQLQLEQFNRIMVKADKIEDILKIQVEIGRVQVDLDRLEGRLRYLNNRIDLGTITVSLQEPAPLGGGPRLLHRRPRRGQDLDQPDQRQRRRS
jgi:hypothetical protein